MQEKIVFLGWVLAAYTYTGYLPVYKEWILTHVVTLGERLEDWSCHR